MDVLKEQSAIFKIMLMNVGVCPCTMLLISKCNNMIKELKETRERGEIGSKEGRRVSCQYAMCFPPLETCMVSSGTGHTSNIVQTELVVLRNTHVCICVYLYIHIHYFCCFILCFCFCFILSFFFHVPMSFIRVSFGNMCDEQK